MYWKFKLPIIAILLLVLITLCYSITKAFKDKMAPKDPALQASTQAPAQPAAPSMDDTAAAQTPTQPATPSSAAQPLTAPKPFTVNENTLAADKAAPAKPAAPADKPLPQPIALNKPEPAAPAEPAKPAVAEKPAEPAKPAEKAAEPAKPAVAEKPAEPAPAEKAAAPAVAEKPAEPAPAEKAAAPAVTEKPVVTAQAPQPALAAPADVNAALDQAAAMAAAAIADKYKLSAPKLLEARTLALSVLNAPGVTEYDTTWRRAAKIVSDINKTFMYSTAHCPEKTTYTIRKGDVLVRIAYRQKTTAEALMAINHKLDPRRLWEDRKLNVLTGDWSIKVSKSQFLLSLYLNGTLYRIFTVGIGRENRTPVGTFRIRDKVMNPAWDSPEDGRIPPDDPRNILGTRWLGLEATGDTNPDLIGYGIHGTTLPDTVGTPSSAGCVRLRNEDVEDLFKFIPEPNSATTTVVINE